MIVIGLWIQQILIDLNDRKISPNRQICLKKAEIYIIYHFLSTKINEKGKSPNQLNSYCNTIVLKKSLISNTRIIFLHSGLFGYFFKCTECFHMFQYILPNLLFKLVICRRHHGYVCLENCKPGLLFGTVELFATYSMFIHSFVGKYCLIFKF